MCGDWQISSFHLVCRPSVNICQRAASPAETHLTASSNNRKKATLSLWSLQRSNHLIGRVSFFFFLFLLFDYFLPLSPILRWQWVDPGGSCPLITHERLVRRECWCWWEVEVMRFAETLPFYFCRFVVLRSSSVTHRLIILTLWRVLILSFHKSISEKKTRLFAGAFLCGRWPCPTVPDLIRNQHYRDECTPASTILYLLLYCVLWPPYIAGYDVPFDIFY